MPKLTDPAAVLIIPNPMNRQLRLLISSLVLGLLFFAMGCAGDQPAPLALEGEPIGMQLLRMVPSLKDERFSTLLDFESPDDAIFCSVVGGGGTVAAAKPHTGKGAFRIDPAARSFNIKLSALLAGRPFPASWTLAGGYFYSEHTTKITVRLEPAIGESKPHEVVLNGGTWTAVFTEIPAAPNTPAIPFLTFDLQSGHDTIWCDDVMLIDNYKLLTGPPEESASTIASSDVAAGVAPPWTIIRRGLNYLGTAPARFNFQLQTTEAAPTEWIVDEANPMRSRFHSIASDANPRRTLTIYADGRAYWNADYKPMSVAGRDPTFAAEHLSPAKIEVSEGMGRVDRNTAGDANNDGYNETTGSYRIIANGPRIELRFIPTGSQVLSPILEFSGLPFGKALITLEGRLVEESTRTASGTLLVELPAKIDRAVTVDVRIEE